MKRNLCLVLFLLLFIYGCATVFNPATQRNEVILISDQNEVALGRNVSRSLAKKEKIYTEAKSQERVEKIGSRIAAVSDRKNIKYEFHIIDNDELNALSLPGGFVYINRGLLNKLNDDELAFVLGHEVGHVAAKHAVKKIQANMAFSILMNIAMNAAPASQINEAAGIARATGTIYNLIELGYSRNDEYFADRLGVKYAYRAGFLAQGAIKALEKIKKEESDNPQLLKYLRTHPYVDDRIKQMQKIIPEITGTK